MTNFTFYLNYIDDLNFNISIYSIMNCLIKTAGIEPNYFIFYNENINNMTS